MHPAVELIAAGTDWPAIVAAIVTGVAAVAGIAAWQAKRAREAAASDLKVSIDAAAANARAAIEASANQYHMDRLTQTYLDVLRGLRLRSDGARGLLRRGVDYGSDDYEAFAARMMAYASPEVYRQWFALNQLYSDTVEPAAEFRRRHGDPPWLEQRTADQWDAMLAPFDAAADRLVDQVRQELG